MAMMNSPDGWGLPARLLHWLMAMLIVGLLCVGFYMANFVSDIYVQFDLTQMHKSWGFLAFSLALIRVVWRLLNPVSPALPDGMSPVERLLAHGGHYALYICMFAMPLTGWLMASASPLQDQYGIPNMVFGLFELPDPFVPGDAGTEEIFSMLHHYLGLALAALVLGHAAAALKHHFINGDTVLRRMLRG